MTAARRGGGALAAEAPGARALIERVFRALEARDVDAALAVARLVRRVRRR